MVATASHTGMLKVDTTFYYSVGDLAGEEQMDSDANIIIVLWPPLMLWVMSYLTPIILNNLNKTFGDG